MREDMLLVRRFNGGDREALRGIYEKYKDGLLGLAVTLLNDASLAEDVLHDVFVGFAQSAGRFRLTGSLKSYLSTCVANDARDKNRKRSARDTTLEAAANMTSELDRPDEAAVGGEEARQLISWLAELPWDQREVVVLHLHHDMKFREITKLRGVSINTIQSRYRYGLNKLRSLAVGQGCEIAK